MYKFQGSGSNGFSAWLLQRISGVIILLLGFCLFFQVALNSAHNFSPWLTMPILGLGLWHTLSGFKMITDDYVSRGVLRLLLLAFYWFVGVAVFVIGLTTAIGAAG